MEGTSRRALKKREGLSISKLTEVFIAGLMRGISLMNEHTEGKQEVSSLTWLFGFAVSWFISCLVVKSIYELNDSSLNGSGLIAIGSVLAVIYFSMTSKASLNKFGRFFLWVGVFAYCLVVVPVEVFSLFNF